MRLLKFGKKEVLKEEVTDEHLFPIDNIDGQVQVAADQLKGVVEHMKLAALSLEETTSSSLSNTKELIAQSEKTADYTSKASERMRAIEESALKISSFSNNIQSSSHSSYNELSVSLESVNILQSKINDLCQNHYQLLEQMNSLVNHSNKISDIIHTIGGISQKTRILALNASIEAARAGEHGKGFSVVANEVGKLANQASNAVEETRRSIEQVQEEIFITKEMVKNETKQVEEGSKEIINVLAYMDSFQTTLSGITDMVNESSQAVVEQTSSVQDIANLLDGISQMTKNNKDYVYKVKFDMDKQFDNVEQIVSISHSLTDTSNELQSLIENVTPTNIVQLDKPVIEKMKSNLLSLQMAEELISLDRTLHEDHLTSFLLSNPSLEAIWTNRLDGTFIYSNPKAGLVNAKARIWFTHAANGEIYVSDIYTSALTKRNCITISLPLLQSGEIVGVLGADLSL